MLKFKIFWGCSLLNNEILVEINFLFAIILLQSMKSQDVLLKGIKSMTHSKLIK